MDIIGYQSVFNRIARYAGDELSTEAKTMARFRRGFNPELKGIADLLDGQGIPKGELKCLLGPNKKPCKVWVQVKTKQLTTGK